MASIGRMEKRILLATTVCTLIAYVLQIIAVCTNDWLISDIPGGLYRNSTGNYLLQVYGGLWRKCFVTMTSKPGSTSNSEGKFQLSKYFYKVYHFCQKNVPGSEYVEIICVW